MAPEENKSCRVRFEYFSHINTHKLSERDIGEEISKRIRTNLSYYVARWVFCHCSIILNSPRMRTSLSDEEKIIRILSSNTVWRSMSYLKENKRYRYIVNR
jgi:hypothetical protein